MSDKLTSADFSPYLNQKFKIHYESSRFLEVELVEVEDFPTKWMGPSKRPPFSIVFRGPKDLVLPQRMYNVEHDKMGTLELFLVPIMPDAEGNLYEGVFN